MVLRQQIEVAMSKADRANEGPTRGKAILKVDEKGIGKFDRFDDGAKIANDEVYLKYRRSDRGYLFGLESFFFQEGLAKIYERATFCELRIDAKGAPVLVDLRGEELVELNPNK